MTQSVFLSASVPDPKRAPEFAASADSVAIAAAVSAFVHVVLGRRKIVWGGHPAITPMIWTVAESFNVDYGKWVQLYQSLYFADEFPDDNQKFQNVTYTDAVDGDRENSLFHMRERMFNEHDFCGAVFVGGMKGIVHEHDLFRQMCPGAAVVPIASTGGAVLTIAEKDWASERELFDNLDYVDLLHTRLGISVRENRYACPEDQPSRTEDRYWKRSWNSGDGHVNSRSPS